MSWCNKKKIVRPQGKVDGFTLIDRKTVCEEHENAAGYHAYWADRVLSEPGLIPYVGDYDWHMFWIDIHLSGKWWIEKEK